MKINNKISSGLTKIDIDSITIVFTFLNTQDCLNFCYINKEAYKYYNIFCYRYSYLSLDMHKINRTQLYNFNSLYVYINKVYNVNNWKNINLLTDPRPKNKNKKIYKKMLEAVEFGGTFNEPWGRKFLPDSVKYIIFHPNSKFNFKLVDINLPSNLKKLYLNKSFNKKINHLPDSLEILSFHRNSVFNQNVSKWPANLKEVYFGEKFNQNIDNLPDSVEIISFSVFSIFNIVVSKYPAKLQSIHFGILYNHSIDNLLKFTNIKEVIFCKKSYFNQSINESSNSLVKISFGADFNNSLDILNISPSLTNIIFYLKSQFNCDINILPENLEVIIFGRSFNSNICPFPPLTNLIKFRPCSKFNNPIYTTNSKIKNLHIGKYFNNLIICKEISALRLYTTYHYSVIANENNCINIKNNSFLNIHNDNSEQY